MESLSIILSSSSFPFLNHPKTLRPTSSKLAPLPLPSTSTPKNPHFFLLESRRPFPRHLTRAHLCFPLFHLFGSLPSLAAEDVVSPAADQVSDRINLESIVVSIDDFFNRNPFFVAGCAFIWLVVVPVAEYYLRKYKYVSAIDAFRKLRDDPDAQLLDIRDRNSLAAMAPPGLKYMSKNVVQVQFDEGREDEFLKAVVASFEDPANTVICILDK
ncbi:rhodanese-like domain-containing protein 4A, chloroplastic [Syzygium oleosum]|uniref:rhodanese-like domain-containing protein 4A, chloroplastic n=1 Tax=Syzygium oleosum TaxID=219896 RepID=UPI0024B91E72|nr:rhodanese-like domain-containing protein 4A, chloroplastic [Syzygium oleosum]